MNWKLIEQKPENWESIQRLLHHCATTFSSLSLSSSISSASHKPIPTTSEKHQWNTIVFQPRYLSFFFQALHSKCQVHKMYNHLSLPTIFGTSLFEEIVQYTKQEEDALQKILSMKCKGGGRIKTKKNKSCSLWEQRFQSYSKTELFQLQQEYQSIPKWIQMIELSFTTWYPQKLSSSSMEWVFIFQMLEWVLVLFPYGLSCPKRRPIALDAFLSFCHLYDKYMNNFQVSSHETSHETSHEMSCHPLYQKVFQKCKDWLFTSLSSSSSSIDAYGLLFSNPQFMVSCFFQKHGTNVSLYPEQERFLQKVVEAIIYDRPLLLGDRRPPGTGKTFMTIPLVQRLQNLGRKQFVLFTCANDLVRLDVARNALLGHHIHLWMGRKYISSDGIVSCILRPHKSCFPSIWKQVYKKEDSEKMGSIEDQFSYYEQSTKRCPDIVVCDLPTTMELLSCPSLRQRCILYLDEVVYHSSSQPLIWDILRHVPRHTILMSSILPPFQPSLSTFVDTFCETYQTTSEESVVEIETKEHACISCSVLNQKGQLCLPHQSLPFSQLPTLIERMKYDALVGRMYTPKDVYHMMMSLGECLPAEFTFSVRFPSLHQIQHRSIREYVCDFFTHLVVHQRQDIFEKCQQFQPRLALSTTDLEFSQCLSTQAFLYQGRSLIVCEDVELMPSLRQCSDLLLQGCPKWDVLEKQQASQQKMLTKEMERLQQRKLDKLSFDQEFATVQEDLSSLSIFSWPKEYQVNTTEHYERFHPISSSTQSQSFVSSFSSQEGFDEQIHQHFDQFFLRLFYSGVGVYSQTLFTDFQRSLFLRSLLNRVTFLFSSHELIFGTNVQGLTNLLIHSSFDAPRSHLYQLMGRVGRMGHSYEAQIVFFSPKMLQRVMSLQEEDESERHVCLEWNRLSISS